MKDMLNKGDIIYMGEPERSVGFDGAFRVLDPKICNNGRPGIFLVSENLVGGEGGRGIAFKDVPKPTDNFYAGSTAQKWCREFYERHFSDAEKAAILSTDKSDEAYVKMRTWKLTGGRECDFECPFVAAPGILQGDKLFPLSVEEADCAAYGFADDASRLAYLRGKPAAWWLRSPHAPDFPKDVGVVFFNGWLLDFVENKNSVFGKAPVCMRPAPNLDSSKIADILPAGGQSGERGYNEWVLRFEGESEEEARGKLKKYAFGRRVCTEQKAASEELGPFARLMMTVFLAFLDRKRKKMQRDKR